MFRKTTTLTFALMMVAVGLVSLVPQVAADDCGAACIENCHAGIGVGRIAAQCDIKHSTVGTDGCMTGTDCSWLVTCSALDHQQSTGCTLHIGDLEQCMPLPPTNPQGQYGVCASLTDPDCMVWLYTHFGDRCVVAKFVT